MSACLPDYQDGLNFHLEDAFPRDLSVLQLFYPLKLPPMVSHLKVFRRSWGTVTKILGSVLCYSPSLLHLGSWTPIHGYCSQDLCWLWWHEAVYLESSRPSSVTPLVGLSSTCIKGLFFDTTQKPPWLFSSWHIALLADLGNLGVPNTNQDLWLPHFLQLFKEGSVDFSCPYLSEFNTFPWHCCAAQPLPGSWPTSSQPVSPSVL